MLPPAAGHSRTAAVPNGIAAVPSLPAIAAKHPADGKIRAVTPVSIPGIPAVVLRLANAIPAIYPEGTGCLFVGLAPRPVGLALSLAGLPVETGST